jgi:hypothetical protein
MKENPFRYGRPVRNPKDFFGREEEIKGIYNHILALNSVSLFGERKIGKTSLLLHISHPQTLIKFRIPENILMFYIDVSSCFFLKSSEVFRKFLECISSRITGEVKEKADYLLKEEYIYFQKFADIVKEINENNQKIVFLLDEFEKLSKIKKDDVFQGMRYLAQMQDIAFVVSTLHDLKSLFGKKRFSTSPFFNIFTNYQLHGLDESASRELITETFERGCQKINSSDVDSIIRFSGTNPFFLKLTCFFYFDECTRGHIAFGETLKSLVQTKLEPHHMYNLEHLPRNEQAALLEIVKTGKASDSLARRSLEGKGYIIEEKGNLIITSESFHNYLELVLDSHLLSLNLFRTRIAEIDAQHYITEDDRNALREAIHRIEDQETDVENLNAPIFDLIGYFETEMRDYIMKALKTAFGAVWFEHALDDSSREEIEKRISKEMKRRMDFQNPQNPLNYSLLENLRDIIARRENWDICFSEYFEEKKPYEVKMQEIIDVRNNIAHFHKINFNEAVIVIQNIVWMLTHMRKVR